MKERTNEEKDEMKGRGEDEEKRRRSKESGEKKR